MQEHEPLKELNTEDLLGRLDSLENRINALEAKFSHEASTVNGWDHKRYSSEPQEATDTGDADRSSLESKIGEYGLAWIGNIVLVFGITFLTQFIQNTGHSILSAILGYASVAAVFVVAYYLRKQYPYLSLMFNLSGELLIFYVTLRLHFFSPGPIIADKTLELVILLLLVIGLMVKALSRKSELMSGLAMILLLVTGIVSNSTHLMLSLASLAAMTATFFFFQFKWGLAFLVLICLVYFTFLNWLFNNPLVGQPIEILTRHQYGYLYLLATGAVFSFIALVRRNDQFPQSLVIGGIMLSGTGFSFVLFIMALAFFKTGYILIFSVISVYCLLYSVILRYYSEWKFSPAFFALYGFLAMSIAVYGFFNFPNSFFLLSIQSLLVVSMALWFRNSLIVVMNTFMFMTLLVAYLLFPKHTNMINFSFALVAVITARVLNWQKERLELKTELLRNIYLVVGFFAVLYAFYKAVPGPYVTLSWVLTALLYFGMSYVVKNIKYRYMALGTILASAVYLFTIDLARIEIVYRVIAFLFLAIISLFVSVFYSRLFRKQNQGIKPE